MRRAVDRWDRGWQAMDVEKLDAQWLVAAIGQPVGVGDRRTRRPSRPSAGAADRAARRRRFPSSPENVESPESLEIPGFLVGGGGRI
jgi:hypothetical protein